MKFSSLVRFLPKCPLVTTLPDGTDVVVTYCNDYENDEGSRVIDLLVTPVAEDREMLTTAGAKIVSVGEAEYNELRVKNYCLIEKLDVVSGSQFVEAIGKLRNKGEVATVISYDMRDDVFVMKFDTDSADETFYIDFDTLKLTFTPY